MRRAFYGSEKGAAAKPPHAQTLLLDATDALCVLRDAGLLRGPLLVALQVAAARWEPGAVGADPLGLSTDDLINSVLPKLGLEQLQALRLFALRVGVVGARLWVAGWGWRGVCVCVCAGLVLRSESLQLAPPLSVPALQLHPPNACLTPASPQPPGPVCHCHRAALHHRPPRRRGRS